MVLIHRNGSVPFAGRRFRTKNQSHSHYAASIDDHFSGQKADLREIFDRILAELQNFGPIRAEAVKTSINLIRDRHIGGIRVGKTYLDLGFLLGREVHSTRIRHTERLGPNRMAFTVRLTAVEDVDPELVGWLREAYFLK